MRAWVSSLRFYWGPDVQAVMDQRAPTSVVILWHNRLFVAPGFYRRYFRDRKLAALVSASGDGAWLAAFMEMLGIHPIRGSRYGRGPQAVRDLIAGQRAGCDIGVTPDGSRGPMYDMKAGAVTVAIKTGAPIVLLSFNFHRAWRLKSWDRFYIPHPFSRVEVRMDTVGSCANLGTEVPKDAAELLKLRMDAITRD